MTQEKLRDRAEKWAAKNCDVNTCALTVFAREQLQKAAEIAASFNNSCDSQKIGVTIERLIRELMD